MPTAPAYRNIKVTVGSTTTTWGDLYLPPANEVPTYDAAGNLTGDARWVYTWDAENRLTSMETTASAVTAGITKQRLEFTYDSENRRVRKVRKGWVSNAWVVQGDLRFLYDGWNLVAELEPVVVTSATSLPAYVRTYTWGKDVTGTEQGAGGVGGLLFVGRYTKDTGTNVLASTLAPMYDGNSNIEGYVKLLVPTANTSAAATTAFKLEYDPFGRELMIEATSPETQATLPPFRFSTKYTDSETDLVYYGHRYYSPELGRWLNRDPIGERGGVNLYGMVGNDPVNRWDYLGLMVTATYDISRQRFEATSDTGEKINCKKSQCSCGDNNEKHTDVPNSGPLPKGTYKIYLRIKGGQTDFRGLGNAWILDPQDGRPKDDMWGTTGRDGLRIHLWVEEAPQKGSNGCIVLNKDCYAAFDAMLSKTTKGPITEIKSPTGRDANGNPTGWESFDKTAELGTLTVK